jgi:hypothetical protein
MRYLKKTIIIFCVLFLFGSLLMAQTDVPKAKLPVLTTSAGQSADVNTLNVILEQAAVNYDYCDVPTVALLKSGVGLSGEASGEGFHVEILTDLEQFPEGTAYQSLIFAIGASLKGMGASGLTVNDELKRVKAIIEYCKENKIFIIAVHAGGESKRGAPGSNNEKMIDAVAPFADYLIVVEDSNKDGRFTKIAKDKGVPLSEVKYALGIVELMDAVYH